MDTVAKLSAWLARQGSPIRVIGVPKTIDNDLMHTDHTPGFGSAAKYVATTMFRAIPIRQYVGIIASSRLVTPQVLVPVQSPAFANAKGIYILITGVPRKAKRNRQTVAVHGRQPATYDQIAAVQRHVGRTGSPGSESLIR